MCYTWPREATTSYQGAYTGFNFRWGAAHLYLVGGALKMALQLQFSAGIYKSRRQSAAPFAHPRIRQFFTFFRPGFRIQIRCFCLDPVFKFLWIRLKPLDPGA